MWKKPDSGRDSNSATHWTQYNRLVSDSVKFIDTNTLQVFNFEHHDRSKCESGMAGGAKSTNVLA